MKRLARRISLLFTLLLILLFLGLPGCATVTSSIADLGKVLNDRQIASCIKWQTYLRGMDIAGGQATGISVTGGADMAQCQEFLKGQAF